jgi:uncharacterized cupin superfamily protein
VIDTAAAVNLGRVIPRIIPLSPMLASEGTTPAPDRLLEGQPEQHVANAFTDSTGQFFAGRWSSTRGKWRVRYTENELCVLMAGRVTLTSDDGTALSFAAGDAFVIPAGFSGTWEVVVDCTKIYAIFEKLT